jgi:putative ABC transport system ATP-binding protein
MKVINQQTKTTFIFSTHDRRVIEIADRLVQIDDGRVAALGVRGAKGWILARSRSDEGDDGDRVGL